MTDTSLGDAQFFANFEFHPVIHFPASYEIFDFTQGYDPNREHQEFGVGRYDEKRSGMYTTELFQSSEGEADARNIHVGIDLAAPVGTAVHAFFEGQIFSFAINPADGDYGGTLITQHRLGDRDLWALYGHLSHRSLEGKRVGQPIEAGEVIAWIGDKHENGGWNPHLHFQLSWKKPTVCDLPGAVSDRDRSEALILYPDPRLVLGPLY